jgi:hypothetical protein
VKFIGVSQQILRPADAGSRQIAEEIQKMDRRAESENNLCTGRRLDYFWLTADLKTHAT